MPPRRCKPPSSGMTLLEVMVGLALVALVAGVVTEGTQFLSRRINQGSQEQVARLLALEKLAEIEAEPIQSVLDGGDFGSRFPGFTWRLSVEPAHLPQMVATGMFDVKLIVAWPTPAGPEELRAATLLADLRTVRRRGR